MYKILITTKHGTSDGCSLHTLVVEFDTEQEANIAINNIREQEDKPIMGFGFIQRAIALF